MGVPALMATLHLHADESGDFNFASTGTDHYTFVVTWTETPGPLARDMEGLKFSLLRDGHDLPCFHAALDQPANRISVINQLVAYPDWQFCAVVVNKAKVYGPLQNPRRFYPKFLSSALRFVLRGRVGPHVDRILIYTDRIPTMKRKAGVEKAIKTTCSAEAGGTTFHLYHHPSASNMWLQVADYCSWSVHRKYEHGDDSYYRLLSPRLAAPELYLWP